MRVWDLEKLTEMYHFDIGLESAKESDLISENLTNVKLINS
jgi:hypothetical protein